MNIVYLQCDARFNQWLLESVSGQYVIEHTISRSKELNCEKIIAGIYNCQENIKLSEVLIKNGVDVRFQDEENVNKRFLDIVCEEKTDFIVRVGGDQLLIDIDKINMILESMQQDNQEWFYEKYIGCVIPDIVSSKCLKKYRENIRENNRYFEGLLNQKEVKRFRLPYPMLIAYDFRANSSMGFKVCKSVLNNQLNVYELSEKFMAKLIKKNYLTETGLLRSWIMPVESELFFYDESGKVNPWWGKSMIDFVKQYLNKTLSVFEWGSGNSTLFWAENVKHVISIEYDKAWYEKMKKIIPSNVELLHIPLEYGGNYCKAILKENSQFDIILIDGRDRVRCVENSITKLKEDGIIIWDNSDRECYSEGYEFLRQYGFKEMKIGGVIYGLPGVEDITSIFYREDNIFGI